MDGIIDFFAELSPRQWLFGVFGLFMLLFLVVDLGLFRPKPQKITFKAALFQTLFWILSSMGFAYLTHEFYDEAIAVQFTVAYFTEKVLSIDNIFVFVLVFNYFKINPKYYHQILFWGILGAFVFRAIFITLGAALIQHFHFVLYLFAVFLLFTGVKMFFQKEEDTFNPGENAFFRFLNKRLNFTPDDANGKFWVRKNGVLYFSNLFLALIFIEVSDIIFAFDSIPAVFAISQDPFVVYTSNMFAIMGLRAMFFLLSSVVERFAYLQQGISFVLVFIGVKMLLEIFDIKIPEVYALLFILATLTISILYSWVKTKVKE